MMAGTCALFWLTVYTCVYICTAQTNITTEKIKADVGENVTLQCKAPDKYRPVKDVEWNRPELDPEYVLLYNDGQLDSLNQDSSYKNRVDLQDKEMKDGNVSMILQNVTKNDTSPYLCWVFEDGKPELICNITLEVHLPGDQDGNTGDGENKNGGNMVALIFVLILGLTGLGFLGFLIYKRWIRKKPKNSVSTDVAETIPMSTFSQSAGPTTASAPLMDPSAEEQTEM